MLLRVGQSSRRGKDQQWIAIYRDAGFVLGELSLVSTIRTVADHNLGVALWTVGQPYSATLSASGESWAYNSTIVSGTLPNGLALNSGDRNNFGHSDRSGRAYRSPSASDGWRVTCPGPNVAVLSLTIQSQILNQGSIYSYSASTMESETSSSLNDSGYWELDVCVRFAEPNCLWICHVRGFERAISLHVLEHDAFGNRTQQEMSSLGFLSGLGGEVHASHNRRSSGHRYCKL